MWLRVRQNEDTLCWQHCRRDHETWTRFCHARNICVQNNFCVLDTKNVSENSQKHFLCPRGAQRCCRVFHGRATSQDTMFPPRWVLVLPGPYFSPSFCAQFFAGIDLYCTYARLDLSNDLQYVEKLYRKNRHSFHNYGQKCGTTWRPSMRLRCASIYFRDGGNIKDWQGKSCNAEFSPFILGNSHLCTSETS